MTDTVYVLSDMVVQEGGNVLSVHRTLEGAQAAAQADFNDSDPGSSPLTWDRSEALGRWQADHPMFPSAYWQVERIEVEP